MPSTSSPAGRTVLLLATGGTIAGVSPQTGQPYVAGVLPPQALLAGLAPTPDVAVQAETVAAIDSKDMDGATWSRLARRVATALEEGWAGVVITHGTDTLEETAYLLARLVDPALPVVLTGAMRPADAADADGPRHLAHAMAVAASGVPAGVWVAWAGRLHRPGALRKLHGWRLDAFDSPEPLALPPPLGWPALPLEGEAWPWVEVVTSHGDARAEGVQALVHAGVQGLVVAGTGNGTVHRRMGAALEAAAAQGVAVWWTSRCAFGGLAEGRHDGGRLSGPPRPPGLMGLAPPLLRLELALQLALGRRRAAQPTAPNPPSTSA